MNVYDVSKAWKKDENARKMSVTSAARFLPLAMKCNERIKLSRAEKFR